MNFLKWLWKDFKCSVINDNRGTWAMVAMGGLSAAGSIGGALINKNKNDGEWNQPPQATWNAKPEYPEAIQARQGFSDKLTGWGEDPDYGAISPDWDDIYGKAQQRIRQYYWGSPVGGDESGLAGKVRASAAGRNVSDSPALQHELNLMGIQEGQDVQELATGVATKQAEFGETGRQNYMTWLSQLMGLEMPGQFQGAQYQAEVPSQIPGLAGQITGSALGGLIKGSSENDWLDKLFSPGGTTGVIGGGAAGGAVGRGLGAIAA